METAEFGNSVDLDEVAHDEFLITNSLDFTFFFKFADEILSSAFSSELKS